MQLSFPSAVFAMVLSLLASGQTATASDSRNPAKQAFDLYTEGYAAFVTKRYDAARLKFKQVLDREQSGALADRAQDYLERIDSLTPPLEKPIARPERRRPEAVRGFEQVTDSRPAYRQYMDSAVEDYEQRLIAAHKARRRNFPNASSLRNASTRKGRSHARDDSRASEFATPGARRFQREDEPDQRPTERDAELESRTIEFAEEVGDRVFFDKGSAQLTRDARDVLQRQARFLMRHARSRVFIHGYASDPGGPAANMSLAEDRAFAVRDMLVREGVASNRIRVTSAGDREKAVRCGSDQVETAKRIQRDLELCHAQNRRVVVGLSSPFDALAYRRTLSSNPE